jgi:nicotinate dehydrogenase subunit A
MINLTVNGVQHALDIDPATPLLYALRNDLQLHGAKFGCGLGQCGACTVIVDGEAVFSCLIPVSSIGKRPVRTIESLGTAEHPGPLQKSFIDHQAVQCGYCIAGMIMRAQALLDADPHPDEATIRAHMQTNLCRLLVVEGLLQRAHAGDRAEALDRAHRPVADRRQRRHAREHRLAIELNGAGAALAQSAAVLGAIEPEIVAQDIEQRGIGGGVDGVRRAVD